MPISQNEAMLTCFGVCGFSSAVFTLLGSWGESAANQTNVCVSMRAAITDTP